MNLPIATLTLFSLATVIAQQPAEDWTLRQPYTAQSPGMALHPVTGRPVLCGGYSLIGALPHLWEWTGDAWLRHVTAPAPVAWLVATDEQRGQLVLVRSGGTWLWDGVHWQSRPSLPSVLIGSPAAYDSLRGRIVVFSGLGAFNNTWEWDGTVWALRPAGINPGVRAGHAMAFDAARGRTVMFGGFDGAFTGFNDTWEWDGTVWQQRFPAVSPPARDQHVMAYDQVRQRVVLWGGVTQQPANLVDTWEWDGANWVRVVTAHSPPPPPMSSLLLPKLLFDRTQNCVTLFRGDVTGEVWSYDGIDWSQVVPGSMPAGRAMATLVDDPPRGNVVLFGGLSHAGLYDDTWTWDGRRWARAASVASPSARGGHAMAFDSAHGVAVLFGGAAYSGITTVPHDDTWTWNGAWTQMQPVNRPPRRAQAGLGFHAPSQRVVLFGGVDGPTGGPLRGDTWTWDGSNWQQENPATSPSARAAPCMTGTAQDVVLFGGANGLTGQIRLADTWTWNGSNWTLLQPATSPPARLFPACTWDSDRARVVLVNGPAPGSGTGTPIDSWAFDGTTWTQLVTGTPPLNRHSHTVAYDARRHELVLFGGINAMYLDGIWTLAVAAEQATFGAGCPGSLGVPTLQASAWSIPEPGGVAGFDVANLPFSFAMMAAGFSRTSAGPQPLPMSLQPFGMPGCALLVSPDATVLLVGSANTATWSLPLPSVPGLLGIELFLQAFAFDPAANAAGVTTSNGGRCRIGN